MWHTLPFLPHTVTRADMRARTHTNHMHMHMHTHTRRAHMVMEECRNFMQLIYEQSPDYFSRAHSSFIYTHDERGFITHERMSFAPGRIVIGRIVIKLYDYASCGIKYCFKPYLHVNVEAS